MVFQFCLTSILGSNMSENAPSPKSPIISPSATIAAAISSVAAAIAGSFFGVAGTLIGAALGSVISTSVSAVLAVGLGHLDRLRWDRLVGPILFALGIGVLVLTCSELIIGKPVSAVVQQKQDNRGTTLVPLGPNKSPDPTPSPTPTPSASTPSPTPLFTESPVEQFSELLESTMAPSDEPTFKMSETPTVAPTPEPTSEATLEPEPAPIEEPTE